MPTKMHKNNQDLTDAYMSANLCFPKSLEALAILQGRAKKIAQAEIKKSQEQNDFLYIHFRLNKNEHYGVSYQLTKEVIQNASITYIPCTLDFIAGVINRRGKLINVINLKKLFGIQDSEEKINQSIVIVENTIMQVGLLVDSVEGSNHCNIDKLNPPMPSNNAIKPNYIVGLHHEKIAILNIEVILSEIEAQLIK